jgi:lysyl-tRNA synthetase class 2
MHDQANSSGKSKETKSAIAIVNKGAGLERWQEMNTVAHLNAAFGARSGKGLLYQDEIATKDNHKIKLNIQHAIVIKSASSSQDMQKVLDEAKQQGLEVAAFTREMLETTDDKKVIANTKEKNKNEVEFLGVLIFGKKNSVDGLTKHLELFS